MDAHIEFAIDKVMRDYRESQDRTLEKKKKKEEYSVDESIIDKLLTEETE